MSYFNVIKLDAIASTNDELKIRYRNGSCANGDLVWTKHQFSGRGQRQNNWVSDSDNSLTFSIFRSFEPQGLPIDFSLNIAVAVALIKTLQFFSIPQLAIKWPNDILSGDKKVGGILIENFLRKKKINASVVGIGLNVNQKKFDQLPNATSMFLGSNKEFKLEVVFKRLLYELESTFFTSEAHKEILHVFYENHLWKKGKLTFFESQNEPFQATPIGITEHGNLRVINEQKEELIIDPQKIRQSYLI